MSGRFAFIALICLLSLALTGCGAAREFAGDAAATATDVAAAATTLAENEAAAFTAVAEYEPTAAPASTSEANPTAEAVEDSPPKELYAIGDRARLDPFRVTVTGIRTTENLDGVPALDGRQFVLVDLTLENTSAEQQEVGMLVQMILEDGAGQAYSFDPGASASSMLNLDGAIEAGERASGTIGFQLPPDAPAPRFVFRTIQPGAMAEAGRVAFAIEP